MESASLKMISDCFIKPKFVSEEAKKPTYMAPWDLAMLNLTYIQKGLLYSLPPEKKKDFSTTNFVHRLKDSFSDTLTHFHPLAGRLATVKQTNPPSVVIFINPDNSPGARFIHASVDLTIDDLLTPTDVPLIVESFFDHHKTIGHDGHQKSLVSIQVTELVDGIFIGCSMSHTVADGTSFWHFFNSLSQVFQSKPIAPPVLKRWVLEGYDPIITLPFTHEDEYVNRPNPPLVRQRIFHLNSNAMAKLKAKVNSECNTTRISTLQTLLAVIWRCVIRARRFPAEKETSCKLPVNVRSRMSPPLPEHYFGVAVQAVGIKTTVGELLDHSIGWAAMQLHEVVVNHGDKQIREYVDSWVKKPIVHKMDMLYDGVGISMSSSPKYDMYGVEFGLGKGVAVLCGNAMKFDAKVSLNAGRPRDGEGLMDVDLSLLPETMALFETDQEFMSLVQL